jgi:hypothetical protein
MSVRDHLDLPFRSLFLHAWDVADEGPDTLMAWIADAGLNTMCYAGTYHSGWFVHPHAPQRRAYLTEGGVCYFRPQLSLYDDTVLKPVISALCRETDWLAETAARLDRYNLRLVSWTIGTHNTRLGLAYPHLTQQTVYGDRLPHALCPSNDDVRAYLAAICHDLATNYPMWGLQLESFGWMSFSHDHHHARDLTELAPLEQELMSICVCPACTQLARASGVDVEIATQAIRRVLDAAFREAPDRPAGHPHSIEELEAGCDALRRLNAWRKRANEDLIRHLKDDALSGTSCRLLLQTGFDPNLADVVDGFACGAYGMDPAAVAETCRSARAAVAGDYNGLFQCFVRLGNGVPRSEDELEQIVNAVACGGCDGVNFYNRSEAPSKMLAWLARIMQARS